MKFSEVKIGQRFMYEGLGCLKATEHRYVYAYNDKEYFAKMYETLTEVELISNCENCQYYESESAYCDALDLTVTTKRQETRGVTALDWIAENPKTFSCSEFEKKESEAGDES